MLAELVIENLSIVGSVRLDLARGLNAISGETGAGKSLLVQAVELLTGERSDVQVVRTGEDAARVEGRFVVDPGPARERTHALLEAWGVAIDDEHEIVVRREVQREGRSRAWVNQSAVTLAALKQLGTALVDVHGQHEHQSLLKTDAQRDLLDRWAGLDEARAGLGAQFRAWREAELELAAHTEAEQRFAAEEAAWTYAVEELTAAELTPGEDEDLASQLARLRHAGRLATAVQRAEQALEESESGEGGERPGARARVAEAERNVREAAAIDPKLAPVADLLASASIAFGEASRALATYLETAPLDPAEAEAVEARHALLERLLRKYRLGIDELIAYRDELTALLARGRDSAVERERLGNAVSVTRHRLDEAAAALSRKRQAAARRFASALAPELAAVGLGAARLSVRVESTESLTPDGADFVQFVFAPNAGEDARPLARIASGGELSRIMLALKTLFARQDGVDLLLFDEVDSGIGGAVARGVGERLARLGRHRQVLCVTHLPVIACQAQRHFRIHKSVRGGRTHAHVERVEGEERIGEIARMLAGDAVTETTRRQARELLGLSR